MPQHLPMVLLIWMQVSRQNNIIVQRSKYHIIFPHSPSSDSEVEESMKYESIGALETLVFAINPLDESTTHLTPEQLATVNVTCIDLKPLSSGQSRHWTSQVSALGQPSKWSTTSQVPYVMLHTMFMFGFAVTNFD